MVRGNWQRRVEQIELRRTEAKQRKHRNDERKGFKSKVQELLCMLDRNKDDIWKRAGDNNHQPWMIHIWTDSLPSDSPPILDMWNETDTPTKSSSKRRNRSASIESEGSASKTTSSGKKKAHPRSKETVVEPEAEMFAAPRLCSSQFFSGKCQNNRGGKKGGCRHVHYPQKSKTLAELLLTKSSSDPSVKKVLFLSNSAHPEVQMDEASTTGGDSSSSMDMVYYFSVPLMLQNLSSEGAPTVGDIIMNTLSEKSCAIGSVVYLMFNGHLLFDRYQDGLVMAEIDFQATALGLASAKCGDSHAGNERDQAILLPGSVLEHVLTFLPDTAVATMSSVCKTWNSEIGKQSDALWKHLLERNSWPFPSESISSNKDPVQQQNSTLRRVFYSHYTAIRDMKAIKAGMSGLLSKKSVEEKEMCFRSFESIQGAPQYPNCCVAVEVWSPNKMIAAYSHDCAVRLFSTVEKAGSSGDRLCRELVCQRLDPYKHTKRRSCRLVTLALDDDIICCLCHVMEDNIEGDASILTVLHRDDFLIADDLEEEGKMEVIDIGQSVLNFLLSCEFVDHGLLQLKDFFADGGELDEVEVLVSQSLAACGYGRFLVEVSVSIPLLVETDDDGNDTDMTLLFRKLFLFSSSAGAIVWMCESNPPTTPMRPRHEDMTLASVSILEGHRIGCRLVSTSPISPAIMGGLIDAAGDFQSPSLLPGSELVRNEILHEGFVLRPMRRRPIRALASQVVVADTIAKEVENGIKQFQSIVSFYPLVHDNGSALYTTLLLTGNLDICLLAPLRDDHIIAVGRLHIPGSNRTEVDDVDGHWFGDTSSASCISLYAILIHVSSKTEIKRICLVDDLETQLGRDVATGGVLPISVAIDGDTVAIGVWWKGVIMTGQEARLTKDSPQGIENPRTIAKSEKKKKKNPRKGGKKDAFARGMSLRG